MSETGKRGLGRGLSALIGDAAAQPVASENTDKVAGSDGLLYLGIDQLQAGRFQPRKNFDAEELASLAASIGKSGVLQPLLVRPLRDDKGDAPLDDKAAEAAGQGAATYEIIAGERRWRAAQKAQLHEVPVIVQPINDVTAMEIGLVENVQRADLNPIEEAEGYQRLIDEFAYTQAELAETIGKSRSHIANLLRLTGAPQAVRAALVSGDLGMGHARALLGLALSEADSAALVKQIIRDGLSVRAVEKLAAETKPPAATKTGKAAKPSAEKSADTRQLEKQLSDYLGLRVTLDDTPGKGGQLTIDYKSLEQLDAVIGKLMRG